MIATVRVRQLYANGLQSHALTDPALRHLWGSSSQEWLPIPGPLGTVRDGFPSHGSSRTKAVVTRPLASLMQTGYTIKEAQPCHATLDGSRAAIARDG
jgi:hypothetical protein